MGMSLVSQIFGHKLRYWTDYNFDLMTVLDKKRDHKPYYSLSSWEHKVMS